MRKIVAKIHLWFSVPFGIIISIVCFSGAVLVFETEIMQACHPSRYYVKEVKQEPLPFSWLIPAVREQLPDTAAISGIQVYPDPERTYRVSAAGQNRISFFVDPYTGLITDIQNGNEGFFPAMRSLHRWLLDDFKRDGSISVGKTLVGVSTLVMVFILLSGIFVWLPKKKSLILKRLKIKVTAGWRRFFYDLHTAGGMYTVLLLLVLALTGLSWSFTWYRNGFYKLLGVDISQSKNSSHTAPKEKGEPKEINYARWSDVLSTLAEQYDTYNSISIQDGSANVSTARMGNTKGSDSYTFEPETGVITDIRLYKDQPHTGKMRGWVYSVHVGSWGGVFTKIITFLASLLGAVFPITGYYLWLKKKNSKRKRQVANK